MQSQMERERPCRLTSSLLTGFMDIIIKNEHLVDEFISNAAPNTTKDKTY